MSNDCNDVSSYPRIIYSNNKLNLKYFERDALLSQKILFALLFEGRYVSGQRLFLDVSLQM